jgi:DNA end-binding protein Ku
VYKETLMMETIHFPDEVRSTQDVPNIPSEQEVVQRELETALLLVDQLTTAFDPEKYTDDYRTALMELIEEKKTGNQIVTATDEKQPVAPSNVTDLMSALQASLDKTKKKKPATRKRTTKAKTLA